jgi:hypothetical protein
MLEITCFLVLSFPILQLHFEKSTTFFLKKTIPWANPGQWYNYKSMELCFGTQTRNTKKKMFVFWITILMLNQPACFLMLGFPILQLTVDRTVFHRSTFRARLKLCTLCRLNTAQFTHVW